MNILIDKDVSKLIRKSSKDNSVTLFMKAGSG
jgi:hypothetical protein